MALIYEQTTSNGDGFISGTSVTWGGLSVNADSPSAIRGANVQAVTFKFKRYGSPTDTSLTGKIVECSTGNLRQTLSSTTTSTVGTSDYIEITFSNSSSSYNIQDGDAIVCEFGTSTAYPNYFGTPSINPAIADGQKFADSGSCNGNQTPWIKVYDSPPSPVLVLLVLDFLHLQLS